MEELGSGTEMDENTGCAGSGSDTKKVLKQQGGNKFPTSNLEKFYAYQYFLYRLQETKTEWDSLVIIPEHSAIINIEVKLGPEDSGEKLKLLENASDQTKQHFSFMQKLFGGMLSKDWVFVRAACVPHLPILEETTKPCVNCQQFILQDVDDVTHWLKQIIEHKLVTSDNHDQTEYENLVAELIYHISIKESSKFDKLISDPLTISRETEKAFTGKTVGISGESVVPDSMLTNKQKALTGKVKGPSEKSVVADSKLTNEQKALTGKVKGLSEKSVVADSKLTNEQKALTGKVKGLLERSDKPDSKLTNEQKALTDLVDDKKAVYMLNSEQLQAVYSKSKFLIIDGDFGTGKTYVLKERAKKCAIDNSKDQLFYIDMTAFSPDSLEYYERTESSVMDIIAVADFDSYPNIKVITTKDLGISVKIPNQTDIMNALNSFLQDNHCDHVFIDEMIIKEIVFPDSIETICVNVKVVDYGFLDWREDFKTMKAKWLETMKVNHNAVHVNLTINMRNSQQIINLAKALVERVSLGTNVMGNHNFYYKNIYDIDLSLLVVAAVKKYFIHKPKESVVVLSIKYETEIFELLHKHFSSTTSVVRDIKEYILKPEGIFVTSIQEFQGAQARNIILIAPSFSEFRNAIYRTMSFAIIILEKHNIKLNSSGAIEDKNLHEFIYPEGKALESHHYHNKYKHNISALTMAILEKYKLFDQDESIAIITYRRISKDIIREANTKFLSLPEEERQEQIYKKIKLENKELYEDVKRNISRNFADISWSYIDNKTGLVNKPRHINYVNLVNVPDTEQFSEFKNIIVFADQNIDHKHEFANWGNEFLPNYSDEEASIYIKWSNRKRNEYDTFCRDVIMLSKPKFAIVVHDDDFDMFSGPKGALNLNEDNNLHEHIPVTNTELSNQ